MKKIILVFVTIISAALTSSAADLTEVWNHIKAQPGLIVQDFPADQARQEGFESLTVALNSAPTSEAIAAVETQAKFINEKQKLSSVTQNGVRVSIFAVPADATASVYKILFVITSDVANDDDKALVCLYGTATREQMLKNLSDMSIENIIGG